MNVQESYSRALEQGTLSLVRRPLSCVFGGSAGRGDREDVIVIGSIGEKSATILPCDSQLSADLDVL